MTHAEGTRRGIEVANEINLNANAVKSGDETLKLERVEFVVFYHRNEDEKRYVLGLDDAKRVRFTFKKDLAVTFSTREAAHDFIGEHSIDECEIEEA